MKKMFYLLATMLLTLSCEKKPGPDPGPGPDVYKNSFVLIGEAFSPSKLAFEEKETFWQGLWQAGDELAVWCTADDTKAGVATLTDGSGKSSASWLLKTNVDAGAKARIFYPATAGPDHYVISGGEDYAWSEEVTLDASWPVEFTLYSPLSYIRLLYGAAKGTELYGATLSGVRFEAEGAALTGAFTPDFAAKTVTPAKSALSWAEVNLAEPQPVYEMDGEIWMAVFPADLTGRKCDFRCSLKDAKGVDRTVEARLAGRKLEAGKVYSIRLQSLGGLVTHGDRSKAEYSPVSIDYKVNATDASFTKGNQTPLDGMNWMDKYNTNPCDRWGGLPGVTPDEITSTNPEGFWRTGKKNGRHVMVDPDGNIALLHGMNGVAPEILKEASSAAGQREFKARFGNDNLAWASWAGKVVAAAGFNFYSTNTKTVSAYAGTITREIEDRLHNPLEDKQLGQVELAFMLRDFRNNYYTASHSGRGFNDQELNVLALVFDPYYLDYIDATARKCAEISRGKKNFIGWYLDNELQFRWDKDSKPGIYLKDWLVLEGGPDHCQAGPYARQFAEDFMRNRYGVEPVLANITPAMEDAFLLEVCRYYYRTATEAIRRHDPDHLVLGTRLHGRPRQLPAVVKACAEYCDVVSINIYAMWEPQDSYFNGNYSVWVAEWDRPFLVSEFYIRDINATFDGKPYSKTGEGGGWYVKGQEDRGRFYQGYTRKLVSYANCVGWEWFQMTDDYAESYNGWNNKGIVTPDYQPYKGILRYMRRHNWNLYQIMDYYCPGIVQGASTEDIPGAVWED